MTGRNQRPNRRFWRIFSYGLASAIGGSAIALLLIVVLFLVVTRC